MILDGKTLAQEILAELKARSGGLAVKRPLRLVAILVGEDPSSVSFLGEKQRAAQEISVDFRVEQFPSGISNEKLRQAIVALGKQTVISGLIVQLPLPEHLNAQAILNAIPLQKDVDVLAEHNVGRFVLGRLAIDPPPVAGVKRLMARYGLSLTGKHSVVVGQGRLIGKPFAWWLANEGATFTATNSETPDLADVVRRADILITGAGKPRLITGVMIKEGVVVFDFGYAKEGEDVVGDVEFETVAPKASAITPVPGGMGPLTVATLFENLFSLSPQHQRQ